MSLTLSRELHGPLADCLAARSRPLAKSARFALYDLDPHDRSGSGAGPIVLVHDFEPAEIDNNLCSAVAHELMPLLASLPVSGGENGYAVSQQETFERFVGAIVRSVDENEQRAWHRFYDNTLRALGRAAREPVDAAPHDVIATFAAVYARAIALVAEVRADTWLDAATCFGFLPLHVARGARAGGLPRRLFACDVDVALVALARDYARHRCLRDVSFFEADILTADVASDPAPAPRRCDVVTAIHVLEHLEPAETALALRALWSRTGRRLIVAVPVEDTPDPRFGHRQVFDQARLLALGDLTDGAARCFDDHGAWLVVDRVARRANGGERPR